MGVFLAEYVATKHYMHAFTEAIAVELEDTGVIVQEVDPGQVATEMAKDFISGPGIPTAEVYVASALNTLGFQAGLLVGMVMVYSGLFSLRFCLFVLGIWL